MNSVLLDFRCIDCNEPLSDFEDDLVDLFEGMCEDCFEKQAQANHDILPDDFKDEFVIEED